MMAAYATLMVFLLFSVKPVSPAATMGLLEAVWGPMCDVSEELDGVPSDALQRAVDAIDAASDMQNAATRAAIYVVKNQAQPKSKGVTILRGYFQAKATAIVKNIGTTDANKLIAATAEAAYLKGRLDEFIHLLEHSREGATNGCMVNTGTTLTSRNQMTKLNNRQCQLRLRTTAAAAAPAFKSVTATGYPSMQQGTDAGDTFQASGTANCKLLTAHNTASYMHSGGAESAIKVAAGYLTIPNTNGTKISLENVQALQADLGSQPAAWHSAWAAINALQQVNKATYANATGELQTWPELAATIAHAVLPPSDKTAPKIKDKIIEHFGGHSQETANEYINLIYNEEIPEGVAGLYIH
uniref:Variant surface glycoprotein 1588 n=1 Tax=Trypanosoma brucei TaxID=5691 RepID=M4TBZ3_9TRYP|nr:variant surface glycoprotein 1588 [Trypanosoma brucei]